MQGAHSIRTIVLLAIWRSAVDPPYQQIKMEVFFGVWIFLMEAGWIIYGNTFIYSDEIRNCDAEALITLDIDDRVDTLRITTIVLICYGYVLLLGICLLMCFYVGASFGFK